MTKFVRSPTLLACLILAGLALLFWALAPAGRANAAQTGPGGTTTAAAASTTQAPTRTPTPLEQIKSGATIPSGAPVIVGDQILFRIQQRVGSFTPTERAAAITQRINGLIGNPFVPQPSINLVDGAGMTDILAGDQVLATVTDADAAAAGEDRYQLATEWANSISSAVAIGRAQFSVKSILLGFLEALVAIAILYLIIRLTNRLYWRLAARLDAGPTDKLRWRTVGSLNLYTSGTLNRFLRSILRWARVIFWIVLLLIYVPLVFSFFPWTCAVVAQLIVYVLQPLATLWNGLIQYLPNLFYLAVIAIVTWGIIRLVRVFFSEVANQNIKISGFDPEWAMFTFKIVAFLAIVGGVIIAFPYLPGSDSPAFRGVTIFLGVLFSLASTSALSNIIASVIQTYTGAFRVGDVICIQNTTGEVIARTLLVTRVRTWKNEIVSIPNSQALNHDVINYTVMAKTEGLVLHTEVTIGYDAPWRQVHQLMIDAAKATPDILGDPPPFVLQTALNDYNISYQLNAYTDRPQRIPRIYSALHQNIQDQFNQAGVEIMSPAFSVLRDGNKVTIPEDYLPNTYEAPGFRFAANGPRPAAKNLVDRPEPDGQDPSAKS